MIEVPVGHGKFALIDDEDIDLLHCHCWNLAKNILQQVGRAKQSISMLKLPRENLTERFQIKLIMRIEIHLTVGGII
jgi:hypothetical protein